MNITDISTTTSYSSTNVQNPRQRTFQDLRSLAQSLQSGDLTSAQSAFATWQNDLQSNANSNSTSDPNATQPFGNNAKANSDVQALQSALQSGDLNGAQKAFATLKQDLRGTHHAHRAHHQQAPAQNDGDADDNGVTANANNGLAPTPGSPSLLNAQA
jgi:hypothetical protein